MDISIENKLSSFSSGETSELRCWTIERKSFPCYQKKKETIGQPVINPIAQLVYVLIVCRRLLLCKRKLFSFLFEVDELAHWHCLSCIYIYIWTDVKNDREGQHSSSSFSLFLIFLFYTRKKNCAYQLIHWHIHLYVYYFMM